MQLDSKFKFCGDGDKTVIHIINESSKLAKKVFKIRHDWVGKVILGKLCKRLRFDHTTIWYLHKPEFIRESET